MPILSDLHGPADLRGLTEAQLDQLAAEIRETIIATVAETGGHLGSSLGVVELTIALHRLLESPRDRIVWDTGHQAYPHKLLTGRLERFGTLRQLDGVGGFPRRSRVARTTSSTAATPAPACRSPRASPTARDLRHGLERIAVVVGDAALMSGLVARGAQRHRPAQDPAADRRSTTTRCRSARRSARSRSTSRQIKLSRAVAAEQGRLRPLVERIPVVGPTVLELSQRLRASVVQLRPAGPAVRGPRASPTSASCPATTSTRCSRRSARPSSCRARRSSTSGPRRAAATSRPRRTRSGSTARRCRRWPSGAGNAGARRHDAPARRDADRIDGRRRRAADATAAEPPTKHPNYTAVFAAELIELARTDRRIVGITAGMPTGTGLSKFQAAFPDRFFDVGIAEQHAVALATGSGDGRHAAGRRALLDVPPAGLRPDRPRRLPERPAGADRGRPGGPRRRGRDEPPGHVHAAGPAPAAEPRDRVARRTSRSCARCSGPRSRRTTRSRCTTRATPGSGCPPSSRSPPDRARRGPARGPRPAVRRVRADRGAGRRGGRRLAADGWSVGVINARFAKPLDRQLILDQARGKRLVVTFEESVVTGGFGSGVLEASRRRAWPTRRCATSRSGSSASRATGSSTTAPWRTCGACCASTATGLAEQVRETLGALELARGDPSGGRPRPDRPRPADRRPEYRARRWKPPRLPVGDSGSKAWHLRFQRSSSATGSREYLARHGYCNHRLRASKSWTHEWRPAHGRSCRCIPSR